MMELKHHTFVGGGGRGYGHISIVNQNRKKERESLHLCSSSLRVFCLRGESGEKVKERKKRRNV